MFKKPWGGEISYISSATAGTLLEAYAELIYFNGMSDTVRLTQIIIFFVELGAFIFRLTQHIYVRWIRD